LAEQPQRGAQIVQGCGDLVIPARAIVKMIPSVKARLLQAFARQRNTLDDGPGFVPASFFDGLEQARAGITPS